MLITITEQRRRSHNILNSSGAQIFSEDGWEFLKGDWPESWVDETEQQRRKPKYNVGLCLTTPYSRSPLRHPLP